MVLFYLFVDCGLIIAASSLTNKYWVGALFYYINADDVPNTEEKRCVMRQLDAGVSDVTFVQNSDKFVCATDTGKRNAYSLFVYIY